MYVLNVKNIYVLNYDASYSFCVSDFQIIRKIFKSFIAIVGIIFINVNQFSFIEKKCINNVFFYTYMYGIIADVAQLFII